MTSYRKEQLECHRQIRDALSRISLSDRIRLRGEVEPYLIFRKEVDRFQETYFSDVCTAACFRSRLSACCTRDGILTFFADHVINALVSEERALSALIDDLSMPDAGFKCVYLGPKGCRWAVKPLICEMFLCESAMHRVCEDAPEAGEAWGRLAIQAKTFRWPDRPVLFDVIEKRFMELGVDSPLMHLHKSPGLVRLKRRYGLV